MLDIFEFMLHLGNICSANQAQEILEKYVLNRRLSDFTDYFMMLVLFFYF